MEEYIRSTHSVTTGILQDHITTVFNSINRNEVDELLMLYYKLQNHDMTNGYEVLLERNQGELSLFHQSRDLEMKYQYVATTPSNCKWIIINFTTHGVGKVYFSDIQLVKGTTATDYVPYGYV